MQPDIEREMAQLRELDVPQLQARHQEVCGEPAGSPHKEHLVRRIAWQLQALAEGGLSPRARRRAEELASDACRRTRAAPKRRRVSDAARKRRDQRLPAPGTILVRSYRGRTLQVKVLEAGFEYDDRLYPSLTAVARQITGMHWNGYHFFGLNGNGGRK